MQKMHPQKLIVDSDQSTEKNQWYYHSEKGFCVLFKRENWTGKH